MKEKILGIPRNVFFLGLVSLFNDFSSEMVQSVMPAFLTAVLGAPIWFVGVIEGFADALASFLKIFSGWFSDIIRKRKLLAVVGYALSVSVRPLLAVVQNFWSVFGLRAVDRIGKGFRDAPRDALISESALPKELGKAFGYHRMMDTIGATVGPLSAFLLLPILHGNYRTLFLIAFFVGFLALGSFFFVREAPFVATSAPRISFKGLGGNKKFLAFLFSLFIFGMGALPISLLLLHTQELHLQLGTMPLFYFVYSFAFVCSAIPLGKLSDAIGERNVIAIGFCAAIASYVALIFVDRVYSFALAFVVLGFYSAATDGIERALATRLVAKEWLATGQGLVNAANGFSALLAGIAGGILWSAFGPHVAFAYAALLSCIGLVVFFFLMRKESAL